MDKIFYNSLMKNKLESSIDGNPYASLDCRSLKKILNDYYSLLSKYDIYEKGVVNDFLHDVKFALDRIELTDIQRTRLELWCCGYSEVEIAQHENVTRWVVSKSIVAACNKLLDWLKSDW